MDYLNDLAENLFSSCDLSSDDDSDSEDIVQTLTRLLYEMCSNGGRSKSGITSRLNGTDKIYFFELPGIDHSDTIRVNLVLSTQKWNIVVIAHRQGDEASRSFHYGYSTPLVETLDKNTASASLKNGLLTIKFSRLENGGTVNDATEEAISITVYPG